MIYLSKHPKYKLVFDLSSSLDVESIDAGAYLAYAFQQGAQEDNLDIFANDVFRKMISGGVNYEQKIKDFVTTMSDDNKDNIRIILK